MVGVGLTGQEGALSRLLGWLLAAGTGLAIGTVLGAISAAGVQRGRAGGLPFWLQNVGGPWIARAFAAGVLARRPLRGMLAGVLALAAGVTFYDLAKLGGLFSGMGVGTFWLAAAVIAGSVFGALGGLAAARPPRRWLTSGIAGGAVASKAAALSVGGLPHPLFSTKLVAAQTLLGLAVPAVLARQGDWWRAGSLVAAVAAMIALLELVTGIPGRLVW